MYPFPKDFDVRQFHFAELEMICFAINSVYLHFSHDLMLTVSCEFEHCAQSAHASARANFPIQRSDLMLLIGSRVTEARVDENADLHLTFSNGGVLRIYTDCSYESYTIKHNGREYFI